MELRIITIIINTFMISFIMEYHLVKLMLSFSLILFFLNIILN